MKLDASRLGASLRGYLARDWGLFDRVRDRERVWLSPAVRAARAFRTVQQLRDAARATCPDWPTEVDREADLENHRRLAVALGRTAGRASATRRGSRPR